MLFANVAMILGIVLSVFSIVFIIKNYLINFKVSRKGYKSTVILFVAILTAILGVLVFNGGYRIQDIINELEYAKDLTAEAINTYKYEQAILSRETVISMVSGCISFTVYYLLHRSIKNEKVEAKGTWNLNGLDSNK
jgi:hypothetical protein